AWRLRNVLRCVLHEYQQQRRCFFAERAWLQPHGFTVWRSCWRTWFRESFGHDCGRIRGRQPLDEHHFGRQQLQEPDDPPVELERAARTAVEVESGSRVRWHPWRTSLGERTVEPVRSEPRHP